MSDTEINSSCIDLRSLTELPLLVLTSRARFKLGLHLSKTPDCLRDATIPFEDVTNRMVNHDPCELKLGKIDRINIQDQNSYKSYVDCNVQHLGSRAMKQHFARPLDQ